MIKINPLIVFRREFDGSGILFEPATGDTFGLKLTELKKKVALPAEAAADVAEFLAALRTRGYIGDI